MPLHGEPLRAPLEKPRSRAAEKKQQDKADLKAWLALRKAVLLRDGYRCRCCGTSGGTLRKVDVHHIRFRSAGGEDSMQNCAALCRICHLELHAYRLYVEGDNAQKRLQFVRAK
jgi:5-methylcytosine-specific restriction endonuclease McrA